MSLYNPTLKYRKVYEKWFNAHVAYSEYLDLEDAGHTKLNFKHYNMKTRLKKRKEDLTKMLEKAR